MSRGSHPRSAAFLKWFSLTRNHAQILDVEVYRVAGPRQATAKDIVSGIGAFIAGGRWNPIGEMKAVYTSQEPETAMKESLEHFRYYGLPISKALPKVMVAVSLKVERLLDLTNPAISAGLPIPMS